MTRDQVWAAYVKRNPAWVRDGARLSAKGIRKMFDETWRLAEAHGRAVEKEYVRAHCKTFEDLLVDATKGFAR